MHHSSLHKSWVILPIFPYLLISPLKSIQWSIKKQSSKNSFLLPHPNLETETSFPPALSDPSHRTHFTILLQIHRISASVSMTFLCCLQGLRQSPLKPLARFLLTSKANRPRFQFPFLVYLSKYALPTHLWKYHFRLGC